MRKTIEYEGVKITVVRATALIGSKRGVISFENEKASKDDDQATLVLRTYSYPMLVAPVVAAEGTLTVEDADGNERTVDFAKQPISFEDFCSIPDELINEWETAVLELNPHWNPMLVVADREKKV